MNMRLKEVSYKITDNEVRCVGGRDLTGVEGRAAELLLGQGGPSVAQQTQRVLRTPSSSGVICRTYMVSVGHSTRATSAWGRSDTAAVGSGVRLPVYMPEGDIVNIDGDGFTPRAKCDGVNENAKAENRERQEKQRHRRGLG